MEIYSFDYDNTNAFTQKYQNKINYTYHCNQFEYPFFHKHLDYWEFTLVVRGSLINQIDDKINLCFTNTFFITQTNVNHRVLKNKKENEQIKYYNFIVRESKIKTICDALESGLYKKLQTLSDAIRVSNSFVMQIEDIIHNIFSLKSGEINKYEELLASAITLFISHLLMHGIEDKKPDDFAEKLLQLMQDPKFPSYNVDDICRIMGYSRMQLSRLMKSNFNLTPHEYLIDYKLNYAENLLITTDTSISAICDMLGYSSKSTFISNFKNRFNKSPLQYKKQINKGLF